ncbi:hypothetical protein GCM10010193_70030 [Kitasatospora atroaurantiaca]|uniref:Uncharacterized protein n=1 Tax=Kitasatospora atroaurantiaca TaxID=285545 RepID=A0A561ENE8_9ACTN|nr:hypothetical protein [Kitasatospora atroaurantiaca]TWE17089.1 hypothetical protein FB465_2094 [Kitasatospora atroaurantiaca]
MSIRPQDLPELRAALLDWTRRHGSDYFKSCVQDGAQRLFFPADPQTAGHWFANTDADRLAKADLYWVSAEMTELCVAAAKSMPEWELAPEDVPSQQGFILFEGLASLRPDYPSTAFSWGPCPRLAAQATLKGGAGLWLSAYTDVAAAYELAGVALDSMRVPMAPLMYAGESLAAYGHREAGDVSINTVDGDEVVSDDDELLTSRVGSLALIKTAWLLLQQGLVDVSELQPDRATVKRLRRAGHAEDLTATRVIDLRHRTTGTGASADREFRHQWIVKGHWRQQWYPSREVHRPVWTAPHVKGPEGAPLIGGEKVYAWKR